METLFEETEPIKEALKIADLLARFKKTEKIAKKKQGNTSKRQSIMKEIQEIIEQENGGKMSGDKMKVLALKLAHVPTEDLYFMKSEGLDYRKRKGQPFSKYIYGSVRVKKLSTV